MLVQLGKVWVDPTKVVGLERGSILTEFKALLSDGDIDNFATIINNALNTQSFGGEDSEKEATS